MEPAMEKVNRLDLQLRDGQANKTGMIELPFTLE
jgi:hypothetical protein